ncbi:phage terminase large subunit family protein [Bradyrhizobium sp. DOA9]|uniref:phage terminase large subunit family protein n=1 Tax=Bradyrhizobium sp. DOA9 TaxID=1126627 RepID=UPI00046818A7|nr:terminase gpA endonuclease subunit [Bradyrhizobium sp. DOA9]GAJ35156.1 terminase large subunit [Bradyrhizobium sp. DOA9]
MCIQIANAERLAMEAAAAAIEPPPQVDYVRWAEENIVFTKRESQFPGPYNRKLFCYFDEPLRALSPDDPCRVVTVIGSAQIGKTVVGNVFVGGSMDMDPTDFLYTHPTENNAIRWSKLKLLPMLRGTTSLNRIFPAGSRDGANSVLMKEHVDGLGAILISGANSPASLSQVTMPRQVQDDLAKWEMNAAGDPEMQADGRSRAAEFAKILKTSTPLVMPGCRITKSFEQGSQEYPYVPCPHCQAMQVLEWENMLAHLDPDKPEAAHFTCVACGCEIEEHHRPQMLAGLEWRAHNQKAKRFHRSFWIWSAYSYLQSWARIAMEWLRVKGDSAAEQTFLNDTCGKAYQAKGEAPPWEKLRDRAAASHYACGEIPAGALVITLGIDCQADRVEWQLVGWGRDFRRFVIAYGVIPGHISEDITRTRLDGLLQQTWPNGFGRRIGIDRAAIDGNAWTEDVWSWAKRHPRSKLIMVRGRGEDSAPRIARVKKERNERTGKILKWAGRFFNFGASVLKMALYRDLAKEDPLQKGFVSFPRGLDDEYFRQLTAEYRKAKKNRQGFEVYKWEKDPGQANEALDTMNQAETAANNFGIRGLPDAIWLKLEQEREIPLAPVQGDLEDLLAPRGATAAASLAPTAQSSAKIRARGRRVLSTGI